MYIIFFLLLFVEFWICFWKKLFSIKDYEISLNLLFIVTKLLFFVQYRPYLFIDTSILLQKLSHYIFQRIYSIFGSYTDAFIHWVFGCAVSLCACSRLRGTQFWNSVDCHNLYLGLVWPEFPQLRKFWKFVIKIQ